MRHRQVQVKELPTHHYRLLKRAEGNCGHILSFRRGEPCYCTEPAAILWEPGGLKEGPDSAAIKLCSRHWDRFREEYPRIEDLRSIEDWTP